MSSSYLHSILPLPEPRTSANEVCNEPLQALSEQELGVLLSQFERFLENLQPFRDQLEPIEQFLRHFDSEIGHLSESLRALQTQSNDLSTGLDSHRDLVERLNPVILDLVIPPAVAQLVLDEPITEAWCSNVHFIAEKQQLIDGISHGSSELGYTEMEMFRELKTKVELLEAKAIERVRDHLIEQVRLLRRSVHASSQAVQSHLLLVKDAFAFLKTRSPQLAAQLQLAYVYTMKWYYTTRFAKYLHSLQKIKLKHIDHLYVLGSNGEQQDAGKTSLLDVMGGGYVSLAAGGNPQNSSALGPASRVTMPEYLLSVSKRIAILSDDSEALRAIPSQIAETTPFAYWLEFAFQQFSNAVLDNVIVEYLFAVDFFYQGSEKCGPLHLPDANAKGQDKSMDWLHVMFEDVFRMGHSYASWLVAGLSHSIGSRIASTSGSAYGAGSPHAGTCDIFAVLLMIRLVQKQNATLHNQFHIPVMEDYHNMLLLLLWPHFTRIVDLHCDALKKNMLGKGLLLHASAAHSHAPIHTTQQFAQLMLGLFQLAFVGDDVDKQQFLREPLGMCITRLRNDFEGALTRASTYIFGTSKSKASQREIFLFNNYVLLVTILGNEFEASPHEFIQEQVQHFQLLCNAYKPK